MGLWDSMDGQWTTVFLRLPPSKASRILRRTCFPEPLQAHIEKQSFLCDHLTQAHQRRFYKTSTKERTRHLFISPDSSESALRCLLAFTHSKPHHTTRQTDKDKHVKHICASPVSRCRRAPQLGVWADRALRISRNPETRSCEFSYH